MAKDADLTVSADDPPDDDLIRRAAGGDSAAWDLLVARHLSSVVSFAWYRLNDRSEAEDVAQETMLRFSKKAPEWEPDGAKVRTWLYRVAGNLCIDRLRARRPEAPIEAVDETGVIDIQPHLGRAARYPPVRTQGAADIAGPAADGINSCLLSGSYSKGSGRHPAAERTCGGITAGASAPGNATGAGAGPG